MTDGSWKKRQVAVRDSHVEDKAEGRLEDVERSHHFEERNASSSFLFFSFFFKEKILKLGFARRSGRSPDERPIVREDR